MVKKKSAKARKAASATAAHRRQPAPRRKIVADGRDIAARTEVLSTMELLETILGHVDMTTVLLAQLVSTRWRSIIQSSLLLQRQLFFVPALSVPGTSTKCHAPSMETPTHNPLLKKYFGCLYTPLNTMEDGLGGSWRGRISEDTNYLRTGKLMGMGMAGVAGRIAGTGKPTSFLRVGASWRRMLVSQPPPQRLEYIHVLDGRSRFNYDRQGPWSSQRMAKQYKTVSLPEGLTMGQLYDLVYAITFDRPTGRLSWVGWPRVETPGRLVNPSGWVAIREPNDYEALSHNWASTDCVVVGEEGVGDDFHGFCREHVQLGYVSTCQRCRQGQPMRRLKVRKRRLRKEVDTLAPFFRCEEYQTGGTLIEEYSESLYSASDSEADDTTDLGDLEQDGETYTQDGDGADGDTTDDSSDDEAWDAASSEDDELH